MSTDVCTSQDTFNTAFSAAMEAYHQQKKDKDKQSTSGGVIYVLIWLLLLVWALWRAFRVSDVNNRVLHVLFALMFSPVYLIASYVGAW